VADLVEEIESEAAAELAKSGRVPFGVGNILRQSQRSKSSTALKNEPSPQHLKSERALIDLRRVLSWKRQASLCDAWLNAGPDVEKDEEVLVTVRRRER
jgi:hypothetical protein